jgi:DNA gyrase/topoisomerase IV subunit A
MRLLAKGIGCGSSPIVGSGFASGNSGTRRQQRDHYATIARHGNLAILDAMDTEAELEQLRTERDELRALVAKQFEDLASLRRELDTLRQRFAEIQNLVDRRYRFSAAVEQELMQRLQQTPPVRN